MTAPICGWSDSCPEADGSTGDCPCEAEACGEFTMVLGPHLTTRHLCERHVDSVVGRGWKLARLPDMNGTPPAGTGTAAEGGADATEGREPADLAGAVEHDAGDARRVASGAVSDAGGGEPVWLVGEILSSPGFTGAARLVDLEPDRSVETPDLAACGRSTCPACAAGAYADAARAHGGPGPDWKAIGLTLWKAGNALHDLSDSSEAPGARRDPAGFLVSLSRALGTVTDAATVVRLELADVERRAAPDRRDPDRGLRFLEHLRSGGTAWVAFVEPGDPLCASCLGVANGLGRPLQCTRTPDGEQPADCARCNRPTSLLVSGPAPGGASTDPDPPAAPESPATTSGRTIDEP